MAELAIPCVWSADTDLHFGQSGVFVGIAEPSDEEPDRTDVLRSAFNSRNARLVEATNHGDEPLLAVHDADFVKFLDTAHEQWIANGYDITYGQPSVLPYIFPIPQFVHHVSPREPHALHANVGRYAFDTMTPIGSGTARAARAAIDCALTACDMVLGGEHSAYAATRPPGHHAGRSFYGGSCYLNSSAGAAQYLRTNGATRVAIIDIDAHHGNGTQEIFYDRNDVWFGSVHIDPAAGWFPHYVGYVDEIGFGQGTGSNVNIPLAATSREPDWIEAVSMLCDLAGATNPDAIVVSLGVDAAVEDPNSPLQVTQEGFRSAGALLNALRVPTVFVQEGGYVVDRIGALVTAVLDGFTAHATPS